MMFVIWNDYIGTGGSEIQPHVEEIGVEDSTVDELQHMLHQMQMGDETVGVLASMTIAPPSPDRANLFSLCFPNETNYGVVIEPADMIDGVVLHDEYHDEMDILGISQFLDVVQREPFSPLKLLEYLSSRLLMRIGLFLLMSFLLLLFLLLTYRDSFDHDSDPIDKRVSPATGNVETVDFSTDDQPIHK
ncbi:hypothetical protein CK203_021855 [Vitis vinifera]|uniref:Uncharacterized protein n=1 Tax=Vitis vinifera TaxID=29760 RepID=A0A438JFE5_VITVI|nr:hypothetical protein CK203_021855 [Vitis vinifera]